MELKEDDIVMCTVKNIEGTTIFVEIEGNGEGSMVMSEVAAGRIRNLREYVYPKKKIVCKILKILPNNIQLSLRRVTAKERDEMQDRYKKERTFFNLLNAATNDPQKIIAKIKETSDIIDFLDKIRETPSLIDKILSKEEAQKLKEMLVKTKEKEKEVKKIILIKSLAENGLKEIKEVLSMPLEIHYLGSSQFSISATAKDFKEAEHIISTTLAEIEKRAKEKKMIFELKEK